MAERQENNSPDEQSELDEKEQTLMDHLVELRDRLLHMVLAILIVFVALFAFAEDIFTLAADPLLVSSVVLFYCGIAFAYFIIFPILFGFFIGIAPEGVAVMTDIGQYLDFIIAIFLAFGIAFEVPVATFLLIAAGITTPDKLADKRPYIIIGAFVVGMLLTPPDVISQSLLAVPIWLLFELGLIMSRIFLKDKPEENVIMQNDEFELTEESEYFHEGEMPEDLSSAEQSTATDDEAELSDEEMEKLFDEAEQEEEENRRDEEKGASDDESDKKS